MKKITSLVLAAVLVLGCLSGGLLNASSASAKSIYFAGEYRRAKGAVTLSMSQYSSPEGKLVGEFTLSSGAHVYLNETGTLKKVKTNVYKCKKQGGRTFTFYVYAKKVVVKMNKKALKGYYDYRGTYKLKNRFYS